MISHPSAQEEGTYFDEYTQAQDAALGNLAQMFWRMVVAAGFLSVVALALSYVLARSINRPIQRISDMLTVGAAQTAAAAGQVSAASQSLAAGASEQAASLEETSASLEELSSMTQRNAENSQKANELTKQGREAAEKGATDMQVMSAPWPPSKYRVTTSPRSSRRLMKSLFKPTSSP